MQKGNENLIKFTLYFTIALGLYLIVAWASYSPLDNAWSIASSATQSVLNKTGALGAWLVDVQYAMFGKVGFIAPIVFTFSAIYILVRKLVPKLSWKKIAIWYGSFVLFICGLSALASVILPNSPYYLSGGFIGEALSQLFGQGIGQVFLLLVGMLFTSIGFYFCSGQVLLSLVQKGYLWVLGGSSFSFKRDSNLSEDREQESFNKEEILQSEAAEPDFVKSLKQYQKAQDNLSESDAELAESNDSNGAISLSVPVLENQLTNLEHFSRPTANVDIKRQELETKQQESEISAHFTDITKFKPLPSDMPMVSIESVNAEKKVDIVESESSLKMAEISPIQETESEIEINEERLFEPQLMPTIHLNPTTETTIEPIHLTEKAEILSSVKIEPVSTTPVKEPEFLQKNHQEVKPITVSLVETEEQNRLDILRDVAQADDEPELLSSPVEKETTIQPQVEVSTATATPNYPNGGYGDSLIHPLLQQSTKKVEKPTTPLPTLDLLNLHNEEKQLMSEQEVREISMRIEQELANFRVKATVEDVLVGPVVTRYEIQPATGTPAAKISRLENDLARTLMLGKIRITEVVAGKPYMGIEAPNRHRETVWLRDVLESPAFQYTKAILPMALGKDISGEPVVVDMTKMPHLLVAGQTGGGKSVGVNTMILSLLFKLSPEQVRFIMIDPKVVELSIYNDIPHLLTPVVTDMKKAENALRWAVEEMDRRYLLLSSLRVRNIEGYNDKIREADEVYKMPIPNPLWKPGDTMDKMPPPLEKMSYIVLVVDEFADLMMSAGKQVEDHIMRIAQKARAVGIHLILATQRPSTDVITGVIKANIPSRIAFTVASQIDSRTILDSGGAESLLGRGDMLYSANGSNEILRVHGAFMTDSEVERVADNWRARGKPDYIESIVASREETSETGERNQSDLDDLFDEVVEYVVDSGVTSISGIQRRFQLGFNRAARILDQLEAQGILSSPDNRGKREVLAR